MNGTPIKITLQLVILCNFERERERERERETMPTVGVKAELLFERLGRRYSEYLSVFVLLRQHPNVPLAPPPCAPCAWTVLRGHTNEATSSTLHAGPRTTWLCIDTLAVASLPTQQIHLLVNRHTRQLCVLCLYRGCEGHIFLMQRCDVQCLTC